MRRLGIVSLLFLLGLPVASRAAEYVQIGVFSSANESQQVRERLEREGFPVVERLVSISDVRAGVLLLVGPFDRVDRARYQLNKLKEKGWPGILRRFDEVRPPLRPTTKLSLEPPVPKKRAEIERPPGLLEPVPEKQLARSAPPEPIHEPIREPLREVAPEIIPETVITKQSLSPEVGLPLPGVPLPEREESQESVVAFPEEKGPGENGMEQRWSGYVALEGRHFRESPLYAGQKSSTASVVLQPELYVAWEGGQSNNKNSLTFTPFIRAGDQDDERNHADIRELMWLNVFDEWELHLGVGRVFWGVTESQHLVDVINQIDLVENPDGEDKLGQPMVNLSRTSNWGTLDLFVLPGFRERTFPGVNGRLRGPLLIDSEQALYESPDGDHHLDWAVRWSHYIGNVDIGLSHFSGTGRAPNFVVGLNALGQPVLIPRYDLLDQTGLSVQAIAGDWTWKLESISAEQLKSRYFAMTGGFEYTHVGLFDSQIDLGILAEYLYDDRGDNAPVPFANDLMVGLRWVFNDVQSSEVLLGMIHDLDGTTNSISLEASRRLGQSWKLALEYRGNSAVESTDILYPIRMDDYLQLELSRYF
jgi:hypothetical protein